MTGIQHSQQEAPTLNIVGEKVALGPFHADAVSYLHKWMNDFSLGVMSGDPLYPMTPAAVQMEIGAELNGTRDNWVGFLLYERLSMRLIGIVELSRIDKGEGTAMFGIMIGERDCHNKGYGTEATSLMLDYAFNVLGLHNVMLMTFGYNDGAIRAYTKAGFQMIGRRRQAHHLGPNRYDVVMMDCLAEEFQRSGRSIIKLP